MARELWSRLRVAGHPITFLDGDALRAVMGDELGHSADDRRRSAMRNARLCRLLAQQGVDVICATISLFHEIHRWNRENIPLLIGTCCQYQAGASVPNGSVFWLPMRSWPLKIPSRFDHVFTSLILQACAAELE